ncbi:hypothetical protein JOC34_000494 [Virgibacillus halotolerans]|uniref:hypothetical protein n=1 Tax=Virgibacillus halotolerans TaxID=1071053 RepID=UPI00195FDBD5|nr:hypothetical protein [Virgibacillus halotolerans]MBM7598137.1 hypothetical protein [Virgibacillus halotolerans]
MNWVKNSNFKDSIIERRSKQKYYDIKVIYMDSTTYTGIWANNPEEAKSKAYYKFLDEDIRKIEIQ